MNGTGAPGPETSPASTAPRPALRAELRLTLDRFALEVDLAIAAGEVVALLGPNGAGKTTVLRALAGLQALDAGTVHLGDATLSDPAARRHVAPAERRVGVVFQEHRLLPHLTARDNVAFGPRARGVPRPVADRDAAAWLDAVGLGDRGGSLPRQLSGGQAQRVALARALATSPQLLLLDEPLAALDVDTRREVRTLLRRHLAAFEGPVLLITHDPVEALTLADRLVVLEDGRLTQTGTPAQVTAHPRSPFVAELVGLNLLRGVADGTLVQVTGGAELRTVEPAHGSVSLLIHPRAIAVHRRVPDGSPRNVVSGEVVDLDVRGDHVRVRVGGGVPLVAEVSPQAASELDLAAGGLVHLAVKATSIDVQPEDGASSGVVTRRSPPGAG